MKKATKTKFKNTAGGALKGVAVIVLGGVTVLQPETAPATLPLIAFLLMGKK